MKNLILFALYFSLIPFMNAQSPFRIKVIDAQTSENIEKAYVFIEEIPLPDQETDRYGIVSFQNVPEERKVRVNVRKVGYLPKQVEVVANRVLDGDNNAIIKLDKEPTTPQVLIWGEVTDKEGNEIENATVEVTVLGKPYVANTDESGNYQIRIEGKVLKSVPSFQIEAKKNGCERSKTTEQVLQSDYINKDIKLNCSNHPPPPTGNLKTQTVNGIKLVITRFEQIGSIATFYFTLENISEAETVKGWKYGNGTLNDQKGYSYKSQKQVVGNSDSYSDLIYQNVVEGYIEFDVGAVEVTKAARFTLSAWYHPGFEIINLPLK